MLASPLEILSSPQAIASHGNTPPVIAITANGSKRRLAFGKRFRRIAIMSTASARKPELERIRTRTIALMSWTATLMNRKEAPQIRAMAARAKYGSQRGRDSDTCRPVVRGEDQGDGAVVLDRHGHHSTKAAGLSLYSAVAEALDEGEVEILGPLWISGTEQAGSAPAAHVRAPRQLRHDQCGAVHVH